MGERNEGEMGTTVTTIKKITGKKSELPFYFIRERKLPRPEFRVYSMSLK